MPAKRKSTLISFCIPLPAITKPQISLWPIHQTVDAGDPATFHCSASGFPRPEIYWSHKNGKSIESRYSFNGQGIMKIRNVRIEDEGEYSCNARNIGGEVSRKAMLYVRGKILIHFVYLRRLILYDLTLLR